MPKPVFANPLKRTSAGTTLTQSAAPAQEFGDSRQTPGPLGAPGSPSGAAASANVRTLRLTELSRHRDLQPRAGLNEDHVARLMAAIQNGASLTGKAIYDGAHYWLWDGNHTVEAHYRLGLQSMIVLVDEGAFEDAKWLSLSANHDHGLSYTREEQQRVILLTLLHPRSKEMSHNALAKRCGCDDKTVAKYRNDAEEFSRLYRRVFGEDPPTSEIPKSNALAIGADGRIINRTNIGKRANSAAQPPAASVVDPTQLSPRPLTLDESIAVIWRVLHLDIPATTAAGERLQWLNAHESHLHYVKALTDGVAFAEATFNQARLAVKNELSQASQVEADQRLARLAQPPITRTLPAPKPLPPDLAALESQLRDLVAQLADPARFILQIDIDGKIQLNAIRNGTTKRGYATTLSEAWNELQKG